MSGQQLGWHMGCLTGPTEGWRTGLGLASGLTPQTPQNQASPQGELPCRR